MLLDYSVITEGWSIFVEVFFCCEIFCGI